MALQNSQHVEFTAPEGHQDEYDDELSVSNSRGKLIWGNEIACWGGGILAFRGTREFLTPPYAERLKSFYLNLKHVYCTLTIPGYWF